MRHLYVTGGKRIWWITDELLEIHVLPVPPEAALYRDENRRGGWYPEASLSPSVVDELKLLFEEQEER